MKRLLKKIKNKRGISLAETIVAIALLTIVSVVIVTISVYSVRTERKNLRNMEVAVLSENAVDCFYFSDNIEQFSDLMEQTNSGYIYDNNVFTLKKTNYQITLNLSADFKTLLITALDDTGKKIYTFSCSK